MDHCSERRLALRKPESSDRLLVVREDVGESLLALRRDLVEPGDARPLHWKTCARASVSFFMNDELQDNERGRDGLQPLAWVRTLPEATAS